ncbi:BTAD domain-containing putative transcriptional regulator [Nonomuraea sp. B12E4]|uniref:BTAD domain-containing putative transcriptional regulator n=1 Tax=Nonomuraea sp. B12E4 TaxID=3153564 RepID=UPI00325C4B16
MRFQILGPTTVLDEEGEPVTLGGPRVRALLTLLALHAGRIVGAEQLVDGMYGERPPEGVANALQSQVSRLRRALGRDLVEFHPAGYRLIADPRDVDAREFELRAQEGRQALADGDPGRAAALLREALELWRGEPLADAPHAEAAAAALAELRLAATEARVQADLDLGRHRELVAELSQLTAAHPLRERLRAQLMRALYGSGRQAEALTVYDKARKLLDEELGVEPGAELAAAHLAVLRADPALGAPATAGGPRFRRGLRAQLTSFVGRSEELAQVGERLGANRLVTLIGPGGAGKTRLATEAAEQAAGDVCVVPLAPVSDGADVPWAVLDALDIRDALLHNPDRPVLDPVARLVTALADRKLLLVLDNCEHLVAATAELTDQLLASCPELRVLVTGREALGITGESILPVAPLRLPPPAAGNPLDHPAVRLFADRAAAVRPGFAVDAGNAAQVTRICRALDGLPLAIELAAARLRTLSLPDIAARLDDRFRLLTRGSRTALPRHQTLHAVVAWSWDLLDEDEQRLAARLTVFVAGARPEAAERVCGLPEDVLFSLAEKSLVEVVDGRYRMLETIRAFCAERLADSGEVAATRDAHADYYLDLVITADSHLRTREQMEWLARLDEESDDLSAAVRWVTESGRLEVGLRLLAHSACYWWMRGHRVASANLAAELLAELDPAPSFEHLDEEYATCVLVTAWTGEADDRLQARLAVVRELLPLTYVPMRVEFLMMLLAMFTGPPDDFDEAYMLVMRNVAHLPPWQRALAHGGSGFVMQIKGKIDEARAHFEQCRAAFTAIGERWGTVLVLSGLSNLCHEQGEFEAACTLAGEALTTAWELGAKTEIAESLCRRGDALMGLDDRMGARDDYAQAAEQSRRNGSTEVLAWAYLGLGEVALAEGDLDQARTLLDQAREVCPDDWYSAQSTRVRIEAGLATLGSP